MDPYLAWRFLRAGFSTEEVNGVLNRWFIQDIYYTYMCLLEESERRIKFRQWYLEDALKANSKLFNF
jgi:hypothetical protein